MAQNVLTTRVERKKEETREKIIRVAMKLFMDQGLESTTMEQIAAQVDIAKGTLYNYFEDREALIRALFEMRRATLRPQVRAAVGKGGDLPFEQRLRAFVRDLFAVYEAHRKFIKVAIETEHLKLTPSSTAQDVQNAIAELVKAGVKEKVIAQSHADMLPLVIAGALKAVVLKRISETTKLDAKDADALVDIILDGARR